ncbi:MAG: TauD/TfdA family dioxygenase [bacterium]|jgi:taurine dioxygenase|nr:taurine dioxygenase [Gammaproteobacteria bacterium]HIL84362.1 taurine dioxygenase [Pseudomonadales bacterium]
MNSHFEVAHLTPIIGSEISGLNLSKPIAPDTLALLRNLWLERKVLFFRDQHLTPDQQVAFTKQFGEVEKYPFLKGLEGNPLVAPVLKLPEETVNFGGIWHSDTTYLEKPADGASLYALELPPIGGDTIFCNMSTAYEALSADVQKSVAGLKAVNSSAKAAISMTRVNRLADAGDQHTPEAFSSVHPVIRLHPETGEPAIYVNQAHTVCIEGLPEADSDRLLNMLYQHARKPEFQCRFRWSVGALALWDNRASHHYPVNDYYGYRRLLHRVSLRGTQPQ